jgi:hypothetical protein
MHYIYKNFVHQVGDQPRLKNPNHLKIIYNNLSRGMQAETKK